MFLHLVFITIGSTFFEMHCRVMVGLFSAQKFTISTANLDISCNNQCYMFKHSQDLVVSETAGINWYKWRRNPRWRPIWPTLEKRKRYTITAMRQPRECCYMYHVQRLMTRSRIKRATCHVQTEDSKTELSRRYIFVSTGVIIVYLLLLLLLFFVVVCSCCLLSAVLLLLLLLPPMFSPCCFPCIVVAFLLLSCCCCCCYCYRLLLSIVDNPILASAPSVIHITVYFSSTVTKARFHFPGLLINYHLETRK